MCILVTAAHAGATWTVNSTGDPASGTASNCSPGNANTCTLRDAIAAAASGDTIEFGVGSNQTITLSSGNPLAVATGLTINGAGSPGLTIDGSNTTTVFYVTGNGVSISDLSIANAKANFLNGNPPFNYYDAGGIANLGSLTLNRTRISKSTSTGVGGGVYNAGTLSVADSTISGNGSGGGAVYNAGTLSVVDSTISGNVGGGINNLGSAVLANSTLSGNSGGAISDAGTLTVTNSTLASNSDGGLLKSSGSATLTNSTLVGNSGGSIVLFTVIPPHIPSAQAGAVAILATLANSLVDTCVFSNVSASALADGGGNLDAGTSCLGATPASASSSSNANLDLGPLQDNGGPTQTMLPGPASNAIDAGIDSICAAAPVNGLDQRGSARPHGLHCDSGAVEAAACYVKHDATGTNDGSSWADAYTNLQSGLANANCDEVWVARGVYKPTVYTDASSPSVSFNIRPSLGVYGGFAGLGTRRDPAVYRTVLSGDIDDNDGGTNGIDASWTQIAGNNSYHVVVIDGTTAAGPAGAGTILDGFTITGGEAENYVGTQWLGGGLFCDGSGSGHACSPRLQNLVFSGNLAGDGGALTNNGDGGASSPQIIDSTFTGNRSDEIGGLLAGGGAMLNSARNNGISSPALANVTFSGNSAASCGGAMHNDTYYASGTSSPVLTNVTFSGNSAFSGSVICNATNGGPVAPVLTNAIVWGNTLATINDSSATATPTLEHVVIQDGCPAYATCANLIGADPLLGPLQDNGGSSPTFMPGAGSPAIDAGLDSACSAAPVSNVDQRGMTRPTGTHCDIGAVEATNLSLSISDNSAFGFYGKPIQYVVTLQNKSATDTIAGVQVSGFGSAALNDAGTSWFCTVGNCTTTQTSGPFTDLATLPPNSSLTWLVNVPVFAGSNDASATMTVDSTGASSVADTDTLAIFRSGFE